MEAERQPSAAAGSRSVAEAGGSQLQGIVRAGTGIPRQSALPLDSMPIACHSHAMANLQVKNVPDTLHQRLRRYAQEHQCTLSDVVLIALERELARREWHDRLAQRPTTDLGVSAASLLAQERQQREQDLT
jgi:plasmid stability protein